MEIAVGFRNGIGNFIMLTPCLQALSDLGSVDIVLDRNWDRKDPIIEIAEHLDFIREVIYDNEYEERSYDICYMSFHNAIDRVFSLMNSEREIPFNRNLHWIDDEILHEIEYYIMEVEEWFDIKLAIPSQTMPTLDFPDDIIDFKDGLILLSNSYLKTPGNTWTHKLYPHWELLIEQIKDFYRDYEIALIGGESDKLWSESLSQKYELVDTCGELSILQTADLIDSCDAIITTDSAPLHIADALKVKGVALFGSTLVSKNGPYNGTIIPVRSPIECSPCQGTRRILECEDRSQCMSTIDPRIVFSVLRKLL